jgi:hypothetical protein
MFLLQFEWNKPEIHRKTIRWNTIIIVKLGFVKIIWLNNQLTDIYNQVVNLGIEDIEVISNYKNKLLEIERSYEYKIEDLIVANNRQSQTIESLSKKKKKKS